MIRLRQVAMAWGPAPVLAWWRSSPSVTSRTQWRRHFDAPVAPQPAGQLVGMPLGGGQGGDGVDGLGAPLGAFGRPRCDGSGAAHDLDGLGRVGEPEASLDGDNLTGGSGFI